jgi:hypothetical protein
MLSPAPTKGSEKASPSNETLAGKTGDDSKFGVMSWNGVVVVRIPKGVPNPLRLGVPWKRYALSNRSSAAQVRLIKRSSYQAHTQQHVGLRCRYTVRGESLCCTFTVLGLGVCLPLDSARQGGLRGLPAKQGCSCWDRTQRCGARACSWLSTYISRLQFPYSSLIAAPKGSSCMSPCSIVIT